MSKSYKELLDTSHLIQSKSKENAKLFIEKGIWNNISTLTLNQWLNNFVSEEEKLLSAFLLNSFIYRTDVQTNSLLKNAFNSVLPSTLEKNVWKVLEQENFLGTLTLDYKTNEDIRIVPVIRNTDDPTKSGPLLARLYRRNININSKHFIWNWQIKEAIEEGAKVIIFIDDMIGSGNQFSEFIEKCDINFESARFIYLPLLACKQGLIFLSEKIPDLEVSPVEVVDNDINFFGQHEIYSDLKDLYIKVEKDKLNSRFLRKFSCGYENLALTISYSHGTPNATLPLYWYESDKFYPLVRR